jgi:hypothetical protein
VDFNQSGRDALVVRGYLSEEERDDGAALKKAIEGVISDMAFELEQEQREPLLRPSKERVTEHRKN